MSKPVVHLASKESRNPYNPLTISAVYVDDVRVQPARTDGTRWIGMLSDHVVVKIGGNGLGTRAPQSRNEFNLWNKSIAKSKWADAFAACLWYTECDGFQILLQERIASPTALRDRVLVARAQHVAKKFGLKDWGKWQAKATPASPFGFKIHDYGISTSYGWHGVKSGKSQPLEEIS